MQTITELRNYHLMRNVDDTQLDWLVMPLEDCQGEYGSTLIDESNWDCAVKQFEALNSGDWDCVCGRIIVKPDTAASALAESIEESLENYPLLDDEDFSKRENEAYNEAWQQYGYRDFMRLIGETYWVDCDEWQVYRYLEDICTVAELQELFESGVSSGEYYITDSDGVAVNLRSFDLSRSELAMFIQKIRHQRNPRIAFRDPAQGNLFDAIS